MKLCPECKSISHYSSYFQGYMCMECENMWRLSKDEQKLEFQEVLIDAEGLHFRNKDGSLLELEDIIPIVMAELQTGKYTLIKMG